MSSALGAVADLVRRESGIDFGASQLASLDAAIARIESGMTPERLLATQRSEALLQRLINEVTVRETFFFRHRGELEAIDWRRSLEAANARRSNVVRVWVAGCASGEEAYSLGILACEAFSSATPPVHVLATDIATAALEQAERGHYAPRSTAAITDDLRRRYFEARDGRLCVGDGVRRLVEFRRHNLIRDLAPTGGHGGFDAILCRNVLIYFDPQTVERVMRSLEAALAPSGMLVLGAADRLTGRAARGLRRPHPRRPQPAERISSPERRTPAKHPGARRGLDEALAAADRGALDLALEITAEALSRDPLDADAYYVRGLAELACGDTRGAIVSFRRAVYIDANFSPALFKLACAHDLLGSLEPARQVYERTLRSLSRYAEAPRRLVREVELADIAVAVHARLASIGATHRSSSTVGAREPGICCADGADGARGTLLAS